MYEPTADGTMALIAVEYITEKGPASLGGQLFSFTSAPNRYGLTRSTSCMCGPGRPTRAAPFADMNPNVSCAYAGHGK